MKISPVTIKTDNGLSAQQSHVAGSDQPPAVTQLQPTDDQLLPSNQPVNRWRGQAPVPARAADPLPSWLSGPFVKHGIIVEPDPNVAWKSKDVFNPAAIVKDGKVHLFPRCEDDSGAGEWHGTSRIGHMVSDDGIHFVPASDPDLPVLEPTEPFEKPGGCEDPRVVQLDNGTYHMTYTAFDGEMARLATATSDDLIHWEKHGLAFTDEQLLANPAFAQSTNGRPWTKAGGVVPEKINGRYVMYFGEGDVFMATSKNGIDWELDPDAEPVMAKREGFFDQGLVEVGPPPWVDEEGIHLLYHGDSPPLGYQLGEVVFDKNDPSKVLRRANTTLIKPDQPYELEGQVGAVIFAEGLVRHNDRWFLYYGAADGKIAVASAPAANPMSPLQVNIAQTRQ